MATPNKAAANIVAPANAQPHTGVATVEHGHAATSAFPPFDKSTFGPQLVWLALTFGFLYFMLSRRLLPRVASVVESRAEGIRSDLAEAEHLKVETDTALKAYEQALTTAKTNAAGIAKSQRDQIAAETDRERAAVDAQMAAKVADAEKRIAQSKMTALSAVSGVATDTVGAIVAKLTGQTVSGAEIASAIAAVKAK